MAEQKKAGTLTPELGLRATLVLQQWMRIERFKARGKKLDALSARMFAADCKLFEKAMRDAGVSP
jgi:hypothetical protein